MSRPRRIRAAVALGFVGLVSPVFALDPALDVFQYTHKAWTAREGFFRGEITAIAQTPDGYLWLGSDFGLLRFDGERALAWQPPAGEHLPSSFIRCLLVSREGTLWIGTNRGLASWKDGKLNQPADMAGEDIQSLLEDREGVVWADSAALNSGRLCAIRGASIECYGKDGSLGALRPLYEDSGGNLWIATPKGIWRWKPEPRKFYAVDGQPSGLAESSDDGILMSTATGIKRFVDGRVGPYPILGSAKLRATNLKRDRDGGLWFAAQGQGLVHVHQGKWEVIGPPDGLSGDEVRALFEDREGNIWAATRGGLDRFRDPAVPTISVKQGLSDTLVASVLGAADGSVWIGTPHGLNRWNAGRITAVPHPLGLLPYLEDRMSRMWVSAIFPPYGVAYYDAGRLASVEGVPPGTPPWSIQEDGDGNVWISRSAGLFHRTGNAPAERIDQGKLGHKDYGLALLPDPSGGGIWVGFTQGGIEYFKNDRVQHSYSVADGLGQGRVEQLQRDRDGTLWAATEGGLSAIKDGRITTLSSRNGLPCDAVHWRMEDDRDSVWVYLACGLVRIPRSELQAWESDPKRIVAFTFYDATDGVTTFALGTLYTPQVTKSKDGKLWFVGETGVSIIDPKHIPVNNNPPPVHIEQIVADRKSHWESLTGQAASDLRLPALTRDLEIDYTALSLVAPEKNRYRVKLEGHDPDWIDMGNERKKFYTDLRPRHYRFRVMASNNSGVWNETGAALDFSIAPAYYQTAWFQALCGFAGLALLWGLYRYRLYQLAREFNVRLDERVSERTRLARDLHDTLLQSFQGLMLRLQVVDDLLPEGKAKAELEKTLDRADQAIAEGRTAVYDLRSSATTTNDLAQAVREVGNELATPGAATFRLVVEGPARDLHPIIRDELYRIAREALRNAFSHAQAHHIEAELIYADRQFRLRIRDDGQGIASEILEEGRPGHYGLPGMRERAKQIGAEFSIWSGAGAGTEIDVTIAGSIAYGASAHGTLPGRSRLRLFRRPAAGAKKAG